jgi:uroporphyrinogen-III synthase
MGPVTSAMLNQLGFKISAEAPESTLDSLVETISKLSIDSPHA